MDKSIEEFQHYTRGVDFPADKEEVASAAEANGAPEDLLRQIRNASRERFEIANQALQAMRGRCKR